MNNINNYDYVKVKSFLTCELIYPYPINIDSRYNSTCVGVFREYFAFDFPTLPRRFSTLALLEAKKGKYKIGYKIINEYDSIIFPLEYFDLEVPSDNFQIDLEQIFEKVIFPTEGKYFIQLFINDIIINEYDFRVSKISRKEFTDDEKKKIMDDPETIKSMYAQLKCKCGFSKKFSLKLDLEKQKEDEKIPESDVFTCEGCGAVINIAELKANMKFCLGTKNIMDVFNRNINEGRQLAVNGFLNAALIMQVTAFEAFMRDSFKIHFDHWFFHLFDGNKDFETNSNLIKKHILKILQQMNLKEQYYDLYFCSSSNDEKDKFKKIEEHNKMIKNLLFGENDKIFSGSQKINFQQISGLLGGFWAYKHILGIDIKKELDRNDKDYHKHLVSCLNFRHRIVHGSEKIRLTVPEMDNKLIKRFEEIIIFIRKFIKQRNKDIEDDKTRLIEHYTTISKGQRG